MAPIWRERETDWNVDVCAYTSLMASLMGTPGLFSFHSFILVCTKRLYAEGARLGLSALSTRPSSVVHVVFNAYTDLVWRSWHWRV